MCAQPKMDKKPVSHVFDMCFANITSHSMFLTHLGCGECKLLSLALLRCVVLDRSFPLLFLLLVHTSQALPALELELASGEGHGSRHLAGAVRRGTQQQLLRLSCSMLRCWLQELP